MAYRSTDLSAIAYANGFTLWHYRTGDSSADVDNAGYFDAASRMLRTGDFILLNAGVGAVPTHGVLVVAASANGTVDVTNLTTFGAVNTD
jgi:hypothetical protein